MGRRIDPVKPPRDLRTTPAEAEVCGTPPIRGQLPQRRAKAALDRRVCPAAAGVGVLRLGYAPDAPLGRSEGAP